MAVPYKQHLTDSENGKLRRGSEPPPFKLAVDDTHMASSSLQEKHLTTQCVMRETVAMIAWEVG